MAKDHRRISEEAAQAIFLLDEPTFLKEIVERVLQELLETEMTEHIGAAPYERTHKRTGQRNGYKPRALSLVSHLAGQLDAELGAWRSRPLEGKGYPYLFVDARYEKARANGRVVSQGVLIVSAVRGTGCARSSPWRWRTPRA
jgi:transposase-like protein